MFGTTFSSGHVYFAYCIARIKKNIFLKESVLCALRAYTGQKNTKNSEKNKSHFFTLQKLPKMYKVALRIFFLFFFF